MTQLVLQPSAAPASKEHFRHTIADPVDLSDHLGLWGSEREELLRIVDSGHVQLSGVTAGASEKQWDKLESGDRFIFAGNKVVFLTGTVLLKFQNAALAESLWGLDRQGRPWQFMYALTQSRYMNCPRLNWSPPWVTPRITMSKVSPSATLRRAPQLWR
jgi:hypothetical protein